MQKDQIQRFRKIIFLIDVLKLACTAFGGPQVHFTLFKKKLIDKKGYLSEDELMELNSLCNMLPGPTSTQTITAIGFKLGGPRLAFLTLGIWILPTSILMFAFALFMTNRSADGHEFSSLRFIQPMASGFIIYAAYRFTQFFIHRKYHWALLIASAVCGVFIQTPYVFPLILLAGGIVSNWVNSRGRISKPEPIKNINWSNFILFLAIFIVAAALGAVTQSKSVRLFENTYRYGSLVFGGGSVLIPMMFNQFVEFKHYLNPDDFLAGVGFLQAMPGPVFSISTYTGAMVMQGDGFIPQVLGALAGTAGIFLPGILLIFFVYPLWSQLKNYAPVKNAVEGINAVSAGLVISSAYLLFLPLEINEVNMLVLLGTLFLLLSTKVPSPVIVIGTVLLGITLS